jgi:hypothetical protein
MIKVINNVLTLQDSFHLYDGLIRENFWNLAKTSSAEKFGGRFPGVSLINNYEVINNHQYWIGYFNCLFDRINQKLLEQHNFSLPRNIKRISLNAQNENHFTEFHRDYLSGYSIVGFLTPQWAEEWGGELNIEGKIIKYKPGDFVLFDSIRLHKSQEIKKIPYWRATVNYVIDK